MSAAVARRRRFVDENERASVPSMTTPSDRIAQVLQGSQIQLLADWVKALRSPAMSRASSAIGDPELQAQCQEFIALFGEGIASGDREDLDAAGWKPVMELLAGVSRSRERQGFSPSETAMFVFSFKEPLLVHLRRAFEGGDQAELFAEIWSLSRLLDRLGSDPGVVEILKSDAQQKMFEVSLPETPARMPASHARMLTSAQIGLVLLSLGGGFLYLRQYFENRNDVEFAVVLGTVAVALGIGALLSAAAAYLATRLWQNGTPERP